MTATMEQALVELYAEANGPATGVALASVGSLARRELGPRSDIDLVLLHDGRTKAIDKLAERLWYPLWDAKVKLDHSVRTPAQCADIAGTELSAGVGLLDLRVIAGDADLAAGARTSLLTSWRGGARKRLPELLSSIEERRHTFGEAAYLLEPDLKESRGGFRDMIMMRALAATWLTDLPHHGVREPYERLLDVRDALHVSSGRALDRLVAAEAADVAARLGLDDVDTLHREVSLAARRIGYAIDQTVRAARGVLPTRRVIPFVRRERKPEFTREAHGLIIHAGEVGLDRGAVLSDPLLGLRAGALAAQRGLPLSPVTALNLGTSSPPIPTPWPEEAREALLELLSAGPSLLGVWEALEVNGCISRWLPAWESIVAKPQHNPIHRHTVDRHSVQTAVECHRFLTQVDRPDLLLLAALFHDIGKADSGIDHAQTGAPVARRAVRDLGLGDEDADLVELLVREHLTLADLATRRDHADPATMQALVDAVDGRADVLGLLRRLTEADARAAGPAAWSPWRAQLITALADRVAGLLRGEQRPAPTDSPLAARMAAAVAADGRPRVEFATDPGGVQVTIAATDRLGLFADTAGLLASHQVTVRSGVLTSTDGVAVNTWQIETTSPGSSQDLPDPAYLVTQLQRLAEADPGVLAGLQRRDARNQRSAPTPVVEVIPQASETAAVVEVRAGDRAGLLWALGAGLTAAGLSIRSAHVSTLAGQAIDTFYLTEPDGSAPDQVRCGQAVDALLLAAASPQDADHLVAARRESSAP